MKVSTYLKAALAGVSLFGAAAAAHAECTTNHVAEGTTECRAGRSYVYHWYEYTCHGNWVPEGTAC